MVAVLGCTPAEIVLVPREAGTEDDVVTAADAVTARDVVTVSDAVTARDAVTVSDAVTARDAVMTVDVPAPQRPVRCADVRRAAPSAGDGEYMLYVQGDAARPWRAWCHAMATTPAEFLTLVMRGTGQNVSQYTAGGTRTGTNVRTIYARVRVDPATLRIAIGDQTFATSSGRITARDVTITSMPYAVAGDCLATGSRTGVANIDLRGTPFAVAADAFALGGFMPGGAATYGSSARVVDLRGGGFCGWNAPRDAPYDPANTAGGFILPLVYVGG